MGAPEARIAGSMTSSRNFGDDQSLRETWAWLSMIIRRLLLASSAPHLERLLPSCDPAPLHGEHGIRLAARHQLVDQAVLVVGVGDPEISGPVADRGHTAEVQEGRILDGREAVHLRAAREARPCRGKL